MARPFVKNRDLVNEVRVTVKMPKPLVEKVKLLAAARFDGSISDTVRAALKMLILSYEPREMTNDRPEPTAAPDPAA